MSAEDLAKWDIARINRSLVPADDWQSQETPVKLTDGKDNGYGLGVSVRTVPRRDDLAHAAKRSASCRRTTSIRTIRLPSSS